jgi:penicillin-binding protein 1A
VAPARVPRRATWWQRFRRWPFSAWLREGTVTRRALRVVALFTALSVVIPGIATAVVLGSYIVLPLPAALPDETPDIASQISTVYAIDGAPVGQFREAYQAIPIPASDIPDTVRRAVIAVEDHDFFDHGGVDFAAVFRAFLANLSARRIRQGGSTITQQLVKNLYTGGERSVLRKLREAVLAAQLERVMTKEEILARYLNTVYLGDSTFGVEAAARSYFRKEARDLTLSEAALLAGVIPAPSRYSPRSHPEVAEERRNLVLDRMLAHGMATEAEVATARGEHPEIHPPPGVESRYPYYTDYVWAYLTTLGGFTEEQLLRGGLRIETALDPALQDKAQATIAKHLPDEADPDAAMVAVEPQTGFVRAVVGGKGDSEVNVALPRMFERGSQGRQPGSSFKAFVLARALDSGVSPNKTYPAPNCIQIGDWHPCNYGDSGYGSASVRSATHRSINTVYAQLVMDVGWKETATLAEKLGIDIDPESERVNPTIALGSWEVSPLEMASAYSVFAARGMRAAPSPVVRVVDRDGRVLLDNTRPKRTRALREVVADNVNDILRGVITGGTAARANINRPAAGKTGTTNSNADAWFIGYTPALSTAVWMGHEEGQIEMPGAVGGRLPATMWAEFMRFALKDVEPTDFSDPAPIDSLRDLARSRQRGGLDPGSRRFPAGFGGVGDDFYRPPSTPIAGAPPDVGPTTTSTRAPRETTTTTSPDEPTTTSSTSTTFPLIGTTSTSTTTTPGPI